MVSNEIDNRLRIKEESKDCYTNPELPVNEIDGGAAKRPRISVAVLPRENETFERSEPNLFFNPSTLNAINGSAVHRDPRLRKQQLSQNPPNSVYSNPQFIRSQLSQNPQNVLSASLRRSYLEGSQTASDLIESSQPIVSRPENQFRDTVRHRATQHLINSPSSAFYANISAAPQYDDELYRQRSPIVVSRHNAPFVSQAIDDNIRDALLGQHFRNIPSQLQTIGNYAGADLGQISQAMGPPDIDDSTEISSSSNTRSIHTQTSGNLLKSDAQMTGVNDRPAAETVTRETQTTKNCGYFSCTIDDISALTKKQRDALNVFKIVSILHWSVLLINLKSF